jgi:CRISPR system Cascade subunit CasE
MGNDGSLPIEVNIKYFCELVKLYLSLVSLKETDGVELSDAALRHKSIFGNPYAIHKAVWRLFPTCRDEQHRAFLYREDVIGGKPSIYVVSEDQPSDGGKFWDVRTKAYDVNVNCGQKLAFALRANPTIAKMDVSGRFKRHDIVMDTIYTQLQNGVPRDMIPAKSEVIQVAGFEWLRDRASRCGFSISKNSIVVEGYQTHKIHKPKSENDITMKTIDYSGILEVTDPELFKESLYCGVGAARGFGCGLMLIKPIR